MNILLFSGSLRKESLNAKLVAVAGQILTTQLDAHITIANLKELALPVYDGDIESAGIPDGVKKLGHMISSANGVVISSPEYNSSIAGSLKNTIDWISRLRPVPFERKCIALLGASPGGFGAIRALGQARIPLDALGAFVYPQTFALPKAHEAFVSTGALADSSIQLRLTQLLSSFIEYTKKLDGPNLK